MLVSWPVSWGRGLWHRRGGDQLDARAAWLPGVGGEGLSSLAEVGQGTPEEGGLILASLSVEEL